MRRHLTKYEDTSAWAEVWIDNPEPYVAHSCEIWHSIPELEDGAPRIAAKVRILKPCADFPHRFRTDTWEIYTPEDAQVLAEVLRESIGRAAR